MTIAEGLMIAGFARLDGSPALCDNVRRFHLVPVTREAGDTIYWIDGEDAPLTPQDDGNKCENRRRKRFVVSVQVRSDSKAGLDDLIVAVNARLDPGVTYGDGVTLHMGAIRTDTEIADQDATKVDMQYEFRYDVPGWSL